MRYAAPVLVGFYYIAATMMSHPMEHNGHCHFNVLRVFALRAVVQGVASQAYLQHLWWWATGLGGLGGAVIDLLLFDRHVWHHCERAAGCDNDGDGRAASLTPAAGVLPVTRVGAALEAADESQLQMVHRNVENDASEAGIMRVDERLA